MAHAALFGIQGLTAPRVGRDRGQQAELVDLSQAFGQMTGLASHLNPRCALRHRLLQLHHTAFQLDPLRVGRQAQQQLLQHPEKLQLLAVLAGIDHLAIGHGGGVIGAQVTQQVQGPRGRLGAGGP